MNARKLSVTVIIANFNGEKYLSTCLESVLATRYSPFEILVVDDGSTDKSEQIIKKFISKDKRVRLLKNDQNIGAAASRNRAAKIAAGEILIFLDNDTQVQSLWISEMVKTLLKDKNRGACQSLLIDFENRDTVQVAGTKIWASTGWGLPIGAGEKSTKKFEEMEIVALSAALAVRKNIFKKIDGFDELEAIVTEDLDLSWRIWISGYKVVLSPKSIVYHWTKSIIMRNNMKHTNERIYFHLTKNSLTSMIKNYEFKNLIKILPYAMIIHISRGLVVYVLTGNLSAVIGSSKGIFWTVHNLHKILIKRKIVNSFRKNNDIFLFKNIILQKSLYNVLKNNFNVA